MVATFWLLGWVLAPAQTINRPAPAMTSAAVKGDWVLTPRLVRGQELVYRGTFTEEASGSRVQFQRAYRFEARYFVLETPPRGIEVAAMTVLNAREPRSSSPHVRVETGSSAVRIERITVDLQGKVSPPAGVSLTVPLEGAPTLEIGPFIEAPRGRLVVNQGWEVSEPGRPAQAWRLAGTESIGGQSCLKLIGVQQSDDWDRPRADRSAWRRQDTLWVAPRTGLGQRLERIIEQHEPARREVAQRSILRYELESALQYPPQFAQDRRQEIQQAFGLRESAQPLLSDPRKNTRQLQALQRRITYHLENQPPTPYREAVLQVKNQIDAAARGEVVPVRHEEPPPAVAVAAPGEQAPDFVAGPITGKESGKLSRWRGRPVLLVFYNPTSYTATDLLRFTQELHTQYGKTITVVGLSVTGNTTKVLEQRDSLRLSFPIYSGGGMRISYGVDATPKLVLIDANGVIRGMFLGWGRETSAEVLAEVRHWLPGR
jgi:peroxiredoxin